MSHYCHYHQSQIFTDFEDNDNDDYNGDDDSAAAAKDDDDNNDDNVECLEGGAPIFTGVTRQRSKLPTFVGVVENKSSSSSSSVPSSSSISSSSPLLNSLTSLWSAYSSSSLLT